MRLLPGWLFVAAGALSVLGCGVAAESPGPHVIGQPIVGGDIDDADKGAVALAFSISALNIFTVHCSGTLIAPNLVLTARHCVSLTQNNGPQNSVDCSQTNFGFQAPGTALRATPLTTPPMQDGPEFYPGVGTVVVPPEGTKICGNDIALITLAGAGIPADLATPIVPRIDSTPDALEKYSAIGFGLTDPNSNSSNGTRMRLDDNVVDCAGNDCSVIYQVEPTEWMGDSRTCPGDSGGPAIDSKGRVMGVLSRGPTGCLSSTYGDVASHKDLIIQTALAAAQSGGYEPPFWATTGKSTPPEQPGDAGSDAAPPTGGDLGDTCSASAPCNSTYLCYSADGVTGTCSAQCGSGGSCPDGLTCAANACVDPSIAGGGNNATSGDSGGCAITHERGPAKPVPWVVGAVGLLFLCRRRR